MTTAQDMVRLIRWLDVNTEELFGKGEERIYSLNLYTDKSFTITAYDETTDTAEIIFNSEGMPTIIFCDGFDINDFYAWSSKQLFDEIKTYLKWQEAETAKEVKDDPTLNDL